jgi:hypothetical protein
MEGLELVDADLRKTGISIGKHPMAFIREEMTKRGILSADQARYLKKRDIASVAGAVIIRQRPMTANNVSLSRSKTRPVLEFRRHARHVRTLSCRHQSEQLSHHPRDLEERGMMKALHFTPLTDLRTEVVSHNFR